MGVYSFFEDKWYDFLDVVDSHFPVYGVVDRIDGVFPSFILFLVIICLIVAGGAWFFFFSGGISGPSGATSFDVSLTINDSSGMHLVGALAQITQSCSGEEGEKNFSIVSGSQGEVSFKSCSNEAEVVVSKEGYLQADILLSFPDDSKKVISLAGSRVISRHLEVSVTDSKGNLISTAQLALLCSGGTGPAQVPILTGTGNNFQPSGGFAFDFNDDCTSVRLKASAGGYLENTVLVEKYDLQKKIVLAAVSLKGTITFVANSPAGPQSGVVIVVTDSLGAKRSFITFGGEATEQFDEGDYSYSATWSGVSVNGSFSVIAEKSDEVVINFEENPVVSSSKVIYLKTVDTNSIVSSSSARVFAMSGTDANLIYPLTAKINGTLGPVQITNPNNYSYKAVIKATGYETKLVDVDLLDSNSSPQIVSLSQGGAKLSVQVIDDANRPVSGAFTKLFISNFKGDFEPAVGSNAGGFVTFSGLPEGNYTIESKTSTASATKGIHVGNFDIDVNIVLVTGTGSFSFNFYSESGAAAVNYNILSRKGIDFNFLSKNTVASFAATSNLLVGTEVKVVVDDDNFFSYESPVFVVQRGNTKKNIYLRKAGGLPNQNSVQMFLRNVFSTNPFSASESIASRLEAKKSYYLLFDLVLNTSSGGDAVANFFVFDANTARRGMSINWAKSIDGTYFVMSKTNSGFLIPDEAAVDSDAVQLNLFVDDSPAPKHIPIILEVTLDDNASGVQTINYQAKLGSSTSLAYSKDFNVGEAFCFSGSSSSCPAVLFSSFLKWNDADWKPIGDFITRVQIGDSYLIKTFARNLTDTDFKIPSLVLSVDKAAQTQLLFSSGGTDKNYFGRPVSLLPLGVTEPIQAQLSLLKSGSATVNVYQDLVAADGAASLSGLPGNHKALRFSVKNKNDLNIEVWGGSIKNTLFEKSSYPSLLVKVRASLVGTRTTVPVAAKWKAFIESPYEEIVGETLTDANGESLISLDLQNRLAGTVIVFTAVDENNSNPARLALTLSAPFKEDVVAAPECLHVNLGGTNIEDVANYFVDLNLPNTINLSVISDCNVSRSVRFVTELFVSGGTEFTISPGMELSVLLDANSAVRSNNGLLGAYPVKITSGSGTLAVTLADFDVVVHDSSSPLQLDKAVFDLSTQKSQSGRVTNTAFSGRKDVYLPSMAIDESAVDLEYAKNGVPSKVDFNLIIDTVGIKAATFGYVMANVIRQGNPYMWCTKVSSKTMAPTEFIFNTTAFKTNINPYDGLCPGVIERYSDSSFPVRTSVLWDGRDPSKSFFTLPVNIQNQILGASLPQSGSLAESSDEKVGRVSFALQDIPLKGNPQSPKKGDIYETYPKTIGPVPNVSSGCLGYYNLPWKDITLPTSFSYDNWHSFVEDSNGRIYVLYSSGYRKIYSFGYFGPENLKGVLYTKASCSDIECYGILKLQNELIRIVTVENEKKFTWSKSVSLTPTEGKVVNLGTYSYYFNPSWDAPKPFGRSVSDGQWVDSNTLMKNLCNTAHPDFIPFELASVKGVPYPTPDVRNPLTEYHDNGKTYSSIRTSGVPAGVRVFLYNGNVYAEYIGTYSLNSNGTGIVSVPQVNSPFIDFNIVKVGSLSDGYSILSVKDWVGNQKVEKKFRIKLLGSQANCFGINGEQGFSGPTFAPRLLLNWNWSAIPKNQCDSSRADYFYCDSTQFSISLFKKLNEIRRAYEEGNASTLPELTSFYSYLMKDGYSQEFLSDFSDYYTNTFLGADSWFTMPDTGLNNLIRDGRISFFLRDDSGTHPFISLPKAGLYRVEISVTQDNNGGVQFVDSSGSHASIAVTFSFYKTAANYNPLYEIPFDGEIGKSSGGFVRSGYGSNIEGGSIALNTAGDVSYETHSSSKALKNSVLDYSAELSKLDSQVVLSLDGSVFGFYPAQATPVLMKITGSAPLVNAAYSYAAGSFDRTTPLLKNWTMVASSIGSNCQDFSGKRTRSFSETGPSSGVRSINWPNATSSGSITLGSVFFTPRVQGAGLVTIQPQDSSVVSFESSSPRLKNSSAIMLDYFDVAGSPAYSNLQSVYEGISSGRLCISSKSPSSVKVYWNPDYLSNLLGAVNISSGQSECS